MIDHKESFKNRFAGQLAIVTGAATGIGRGIAERLGSEGATLALLDRNLAQLELTAAEFRNAGFSAHTYETDISDENSVQSTFREIEKTLGSPQALVNCAGIVGPTATSILDYPTGDFDKVCAVNLRGSFLLTKYALSLMIPRKYGRILMVASISGKEGNPFMAGYTSSKAGVVGLVKGIAKEFPESGVTINGIAPAVIMTDLVRSCAPAQVEYMTSKIPMKRCGTIEEVAALSAWIVSKECSFTTGFVFDLSGGRATY